MRGVNGKTDRLAGGTSSCSPPKSTSTNPQRGQSLSRQRRGRSHQRDDRADYRPPEREWWRGPSQVKRGRAIEAEKAAVAPTGNQLDPGEGLHGWAAHQSLYSTRKKRQNLWRSQGVEPKLQPRRRAPHRDRVYVGAGSLDPTLARLWEWRELSRGQKLKRPGELNGWF